jgi:cation diffusion facilitator CzcD-associated flavoprotein CzcO
MSTQTQVRESVRSPGKAEHFDVLIVGAGISGIGGAYHLQTQTPGKSFVILEQLDGFGGTWWSHRYPGIRSDSDLYTFGYRFKPWTSAPIASAEEILKYMGEVIEENDLARHIRYNHTITHAEWSSADNLWAVEAVRKDTGETLRFTCNFLWMCQGYYRQNQGYTPEWPGMSDYKGKIVHPQEWPEDLDYKGKKVICIGSGATAATVVPAIAADVAHVTLVQRSPTFFVPGRNADELADTLRLLQVDETWIHEIVRRKRLYDQDLFTRRAVEEPDVVKEELLAGVRAFLPEDVVQKHFMPKYRPWQQRIAFVPDGDLFQGVIAGKASVVTGEIERFTEKGLKMKSGEEIEADIILTATGFNLNAFGDIDFVVDGKPVAASDTVTYRGMMFTGIPNMIWVMGYFRASWTLRADLIGDFVCRLLQHMDEKGAKKIEVVMGPEEEKLERLPWIDPDNFNPGYLARGMHLMPKRLPKWEWQHTQDYWREKDEFPQINLDGSEFKYS